MEYFWRFHKYLKKTLPTRQSSHSASLADTYFYLPGSVEEQNSSGRQTTGELNLKNGLGKMPREKAPFCFINAA
jgi:hypothetical protein